MLLWRRSCGCVAGAPAIRLRAAVEEGAAVRFLKVSLPGNPQCRLCPVVRFRPHYKIRVRVCEKRRYCILCIECIFGVFCPLFFADVHTCCLGQVKCCAQVHVAMSVFQGVGVETVGMRRLVLGREAADAVEVGPAPSPQSVAIAMASCTYSA